MCARLAGAGAQLSMLECVLKHACECCLFTFSSMLVHISSMCVLYLSYTVSIIGDPFPVFKKLLPKQRNCKVTIANTILYIPSLQNLIPVNRLSSLGALLHPSADQQIGIRFGNSFAPVSRSVDRHSFRHLRISFEARSVHSTNLQTMEFSTTGITSCLPACNPGIILALNLDSCPAFAVSS